MKTVIKILLVISLGLFFSNVAQGQLVSEKYCKQIETSVVTPLKPIRWYHNIVFSNECSFNFSVANEKTAVIFQVEKYKNTKDAYKSFRSDFDDFCTSDIRKTRAIKLNKYKFWEKAFTCESENDETVIGLWLKGKTFVSILTNKQNLLIAEKSLTNISNLDE